MIGIGNRHNLLYPLMLMVFIILRRANRIALETINEGTNIILLLSSLNVLSDFIFSSIISLFLKEKKKKESTNQIRGIRLLYYKVDNIDPQDSQTKILILILLASYFNFTSLIIKKLLHMHIDSELLVNMKIRSIDICISSLIYYYIMKKKMYKHHKASLGIIIICILIIIIYQLIDHFKFIKQIILMLLIIICVNIFEAFFDIIQKHLMDNNYINPFKLLIFEGFFEIIFTSFLFFFDSYKKEIKTIKDIYNNNSSKGYLYISLFFTYFIFSGFRNIYQILTIRQYSPPARALSDSIKDPLLIIYNLIIGKESITEFFLWVNFTCSIITVFFNFVYNEFIILYCFNLAYQTHIEIDKRNKNIEYINNSIDENKVFNKVNFSLL